MGYNTAASFAVGHALVAVYVGMLVPALLVVSAIVAWAARHQRRVLAARLNDYTVYGWLKPAQIPYLVERADRAAFRRQARALGRPELEKVRTVQRTGVDLATLRDRMVRGVASEEELSREGNLITELRDLLGRVVSPGGQAGSADLAPARSSW
jgi:hypothetical protein